MSLSNGQKGRFWFSLGFGGLTCMELGMGVFRSAFSCTKDMSVQGCL